MNVCDNHIFVGYVCRLYDFVSTGTIPEFRYSRLQDTIPDVNQNEGYSMISEENEEVDEEEDNEMEKGNNNYNCSWIKRGTGRYN